MLGHAVRTDVAGWALSLVAHDYGKVLLVCASLHRSQIHQLTIRLLQIFMRLSNAPLLVDTLRATHSIVSLGA